VSTSRIALDLSSFLDSPHAGKVPGLTRDQERAALEQFLRAAYDDLGHAPHLLDGHELHELLGHVLPGRFGRNDPAIPRVPQLLTHYFDHLEDEVSLKHPFEVRSALDATADEFVQAATSGRVAHHGTPVAPIVNKAPKLGRNDPCWCGSEKKFKKCHGAGS
jgi:SEC-C motif